MNVAVVAVWAIVASLLTAVGSIVAPLPHNATIVAAPAESHPPAVSAPQTPRNSAPEAITAPKEAPPAPITPGDCRAFLALATDVGWPASELDTLRRIMHAESGCDPRAIGDKTRGYSYGLMQIHLPTWCRPSRYWPHGYLYTHHVLPADDCEPLLDPATNLRAALIVHRVGGWKQWSTYRP